MPTRDPCLVDARDRIGVVPKLGDPLLDRYVEFVASRTRANTVKATVSDLRSMLLQAKSLIDELLRPDGYNLVWNVEPDAGQEVAHVHLHLIPRFHDEPYAGQGARWHLKQSANLRRDPSAPGRGRAVQ